MGTYNLPRSVKGEGRILFIFTAKSLIYTGITAILGLLFFFLFKSLGLPVLGIIIVVLFALIGFTIGTFKVPNLQNFKWARINAGENIDDVIKRAIMFKKRKNKIYIYKEDYTNDK